MGTAGPESASACPTLLEVMSASLRTLSSVLAALCAAAGAGYVASVASILFAAPVHHSPAELPAVGLISETPPLPTGELYIRVSGVDGEDFNQFLGCTGDPDHDPHACTVLEERSDALAEVGEETVCTDTVYGPETAVITGRWNGEDVVTELNRQGSCEEARWQRLQFLAEPIE
jgi:hypothetical protein